MKKYDVVVAGSINVDLTTETPRLPRAGQTVLGRRSHLSFGGKGANQAVAAARLGAETALIGRIGDDLLGRRVLDHLRGCGVRTSQVKRCAGLSTGLATILLTPDGENRIVVAPGANAALLPEHVDAARRLIASAGVLVLQLEIPLATVQAAVRLARHVGTRVILNPAPAQRLPRDLLQSCWCLVPNANEAARLAGGRIAGKRDALRAARKLRKLGCENVVVTLGKNGVVFAGAEGAWYWPAQKARVVDTTGAGDAFVGSFAQAIAAGLEMRQAIGRATLYAALSTEQLGAQAAYLEAAAFAKVWRRRRAQVVSRRI